MRRWVMLSAVVLTFQAQAEIYKCKDAEGKISYQGTPCPTGMVGTIKPPPAVSEENRKHAHERLERMNEKNRQSDITREQEWQKQQEQARRLAEQQERERQQAERERLEQEQRERYYWYPWFPRFPWFTPKPPPRPQPHPPAGGASPSRSGGHHPHHTQK